MRVGVLLTHPVQYLTPWLRRLAQRADLRVFYAHRATPDDQARAGYGRAFSWDVDLLDGYEHEFLPNLARPGASHFASYDTPAIFDRVRRDQFDGFVVCGWGVKSYLQALAACRLFRVPVVSRGDSELLTPRGTAVRVAKDALYPLFLRAFDGHLYVGERNRRYFEHYRFPESRLFHAPHSVDVQRFEEGASAARAAGRSVRAEWGVSDDERVVLFVGRLIPLKRAGDVLSAIARLPELGLRAVFVGEGPERDSLQAEADRLGVRAVFAGFQNQSRLPAVFAGADVLVLPSAHETWGLVVNEAMSAGIPAVVSDACGCGPELLDSEATGARFPVGDVARFAEALARVVPRAGSDATRQALAAKMLSHSPDVTAECTVAALRALAARHGRDASRTPRSE